MSSGTSTDRRSGEAASLARKRLRGSWESIATEAVIGADFDALVVKVLSLEETEPRPPGDVHGDGSRYLLAHRRRISNQDSLSNSR